MWSSRPGMLIADSHLALSSEACSVILARSSSAESLRLTGSEPSSERLASSSASVRQSTAAEPPTPRGSKPTMS